MADPTDEILRALATRSGEARLVADRGRVGFAGGDRCLTIDHIAAELLRLREALRAADELADEIERHNDDIGMQALGYVARYRVARGER